MSTLPVLVIQPDELDPLGPFGEWLISAGIELHVVRPYSPEWVEPDLADFHGLIVLGGNLCSHDGSEPGWLASIRTVLTQAVAQRVPTLAICLGAQLLAQVAGGRVAPNPEGPEYGARLIAKRSAAASDPLFAELPITPDVIQWHADAVVSLPPAAVLLAASPGCEVEAFRVGELAWGVQFHPEATPAIVRSWVDLDRPAFAEYDIGTIVARIDGIAEDLVQVWRPFAETFAHIVQDPILAAKASAGATSETVAAAVTDPAQIRAMLAAEMQTSRMPLSGGPVPVQLLLSPRATEEPKNPKDSPTSDPPEQL